ncbi:MULTISPECIES: TatD family hydrolase [Shouchella]|uniref:TatD family hydrolase n=2 Tax=Shouchella TaxID=2893057 RepID=A0ABY7W8W9_9BACI|nr:MULTISPECIES: TatD family hydrolase [Shouchella]MED4126861.1 TatD family hydrolase [Shouchella miscanthi]WDF05378.1 TatD family hydrolase [Shouchella hunanensis]GAF22119.1 deoxyribonuclease YcfH [Bacillus sp. JCM 19047]
MLIDTHVHLNADQFEDDVNETILRAREAGVKEMVVVGFDEKTINRAMELIEKDDHIYAAIGWHPVDAVDMTDDHLSWIEELSKHPKVVALGEMGLDYYWDKSPKEVQKDVFRKQIALAKKVKLPIIIHNRDADQDVVDLLEEEQAKEVGGVMHCFGGSVETAERCIKNNFYIGLGGPVTFKNAKRPKEVAKQIPLNRLVVETDAPFLAPHPYRGKRNEPAYVKRVAEDIADIREMSFEELCQKTTENAKKLFGLNEQ